MDHDPLRAELHGQARLKMPGGGLVCGCCSLDLLLEWSAGSLCEQHLQKPVDPMLMVLQASQISAADVPARNLTRSIRLPKAMPEEALGASPIKTAGNDIDALLNETRWRNRCAPPHRGSVALWLERGIAPNGVLRGRASQTGAGLRHRGRHPSLRSAFGRLRRCGAARHCEFAPRQLLLCEHSSRRVRWTSALARCNAAARRGGAASSLADSFCG